MLIKSLYTLCKLAKRFLQMRQDFEIMLILEGKLPNILQPFNRFLSLKSAADFEQTISRKKIFDYLVKRANMYCS